MTSKEMTREQLLKWQAKKGRFIRENKPWMPSNKAKVPAADLELRRKPFRELKDGNSDIQNPEPGNHDKGKNLYAGPAKATHLLKPMDGQAVARSVQGKRKAIESVAPETESSRRKQLDDWKKQKLQKANEARMAKPAFVSSAHLDYRRYTLDALPNFGLSKGVLVLPKPNPSVKQSDRRQTMGFQNKRTTTLAKHTVPPRQLLPSTSSLRKSEYPVHTVTGPPKRPAPAKKSFTQLNLKATSSIDRFHSSTKGQPATLAPVVKTPIFKSVNASRKKSLPPVNLHRKQNVQKKMEPSKSVQVASVPIAHTLIEETVITISTEDCMIVQAREGNDELAPSSPVARDPVGVAASIIVEPDHTVDVALRSAKMRARKSLSTLHRMSATAFKKPVVVVTRKPTGISAENVTGDQLSRRETFGVSTNSVSVSNRFSSVSVPKEKPSLAGVTKLQLQPMPSTSKMSCASGVGDVKIPSAMTLRNAKSAKVTPAKIKSGKFAFSKVGTARVIPSKIGPLKVAPRKISPPKNTLANRAQSKVTSSKINKLKVTPAKIIRPKVIAVKIGPPKLTSAEISPPKVTPAEISPPKVTPAEISPPKVTPAEIASPKFIPTEIEAPIVSPVKNSPPKVTPAKIGSKEVTPAKAKTLLTFVEGVCTTAFVENRVATPSGGHAGCSTDRPTLKKVSFNSPSENGVVAIKTPKPASLARRSNLQASCSQQLEQCTPVTGILKSVGRKLIRKSVAFHIKKNSPRFDPALRANLDAWLAKKKLTPSICRHLHCFGGVSANDFLTPKKGKSPSTPISGRKSAGRSARTKFAGHTPLKQMSFNEVSAKVLNDTGKSDSSPAKSPIQQSPISPPKAATSQQIADVDLQHGLSPTKSTTSSILSTLQGANVDLLNLLKASYPPQRVSEWLDELYLSNPVVQELAEYWECRAMVSASCGDVQEAKLLLDRGMLLNAQPSLKLVEARKSLKRSGTPRKASAKKSSQKKIDFRSSVVQFEVADKSTAYKKVFDTNCSQNVAPLARVTPVRRSRRLSRMRTPIPPTPSSDRRATFCVDTLNEIPTVFRRNIFYADNPSMHLLMAATSPEMPCYLRKRVVKKPRL